jgi:predicted phage terminase large subunit-like protein
MVQPSVSSGEPLVLPTRSQSGIWRFLPKYAKFQAEAILGFTVTFLANKYDQPKPVPDFHQEMWGVFSIAHGQAAVAAPRGHAKSTAITFAYALYLLMTRKSKHMLIISSNEGIASDFLKDIATTLKENDQLIAYFGIHAFLKDSETEIVVQFDTGEKFRVVAKGANQRMRGMKWDHKRPDYVICDDMEDEELVMSPERRDKFKKWFYGAVKPIVKAGGRIRVVGTVMHMDSLLNKMLPDPKDIDTVEFNLRTYNKNFIKKPDGSKQPWLSVKYRAHDDSFTEILWPTQFSREKFMEIRADYARMGILDIYGQEYLNNPIDPTTAYFRRSDFLPIEDKERGDNTKKTYYAACDLAITEKKRSAYSVIVVGGVDSAGFLHIVDVRRGRWDSLQIADEIFSVSKRYNVEIFRIENENIAKSIGPFLYKRMDETGEYINLDPSPPTKDKEQRAQAIRARMRAGRVKFDKTAEWYAGLEEEMCQFPKSEYVDQTDAMAWLGLALEQFLNPPTPEQEEEWAYEQQLEDYSDFGRSLVAGY